MDKAITRKSACLCPFHQCKGTVTHDEQMIYAIYCKDCELKCGQEKQRIHFANLDQGRQRRFI